MPAFSFTTDLGRDLELAGGASLAKVARCPEVGPACRDHGSLSHCGPILNPMSTDVWQPMSAREGGAGGLREYVPASLCDPLRDWIFQVAGNYPSMVQRIRLRLELSWNPGQKRRRAAKSRESVGLTTPEPTYEEEELEAREFLAYGTHAKDLLDIADAALDLLPRTVPWRKVGGLTGINAMWEE